MPEKPDALFAKKASQLIAQGNAAQALQLCADGIAWYPEYASGYLVLARAYQALGKHSDAEIVFKEIEQSFRVQVPKNVSEPTQSSEPDVQQTTSVEPEQITLPPVVEITPLPVVEITPPPVVEITPPPVVELMTELAHTVSPLRLIELGTQPNDTRIIKSSSVRLIPGLEFATLTVQDTSASNGGFTRAYDSLPEPPMYREFKTKQRTMAKKPVTLDDLAKRLEKARIPRPEETYKQQQNQPQQSAAIPSASVISETIANIFFQQGHYQRALEAYTALLPNKPERAKELTAKILECKQMLETL